MAGRHALQELCVSQFVPNDTLLTSGQTGECAQIITGANASGKVNNCNVFEA